MKSFLVILMIVLVSGCKTALNISAKKTVDYKNYQEDVSQTLPVFPEFDQKVVQKEKPVSISNLAVDNKLAAVDQQVASENQLEPYFEGFTVLVYSGVDRVKAFDTQNSLNLFYPSMNARMQYEEPRYLLKVGSYKHRIEAQKNYSLLKQTFPSARIIQDRIQKKGYKLNSGMNEDNEEEN